MKLRLISAFVITLVAASAQLVLAQGTVMDWTIDGVKRQALVFAPKDAGKKEKAPIVFAFHGHGGNMHGTSQLMNIQTAWPEAIVVYPQGLDTVSALDPQGHKPGWQDEVGQFGDRDLKLFDEMLSTMEQKFSVDEERVYAMGFSNGAFFSYLLWSARAEKIAAFAICAGKIFPSDNLTKARAAIIIVGKKDTTVGMQPQQDAIDKVRQLDQATGQGQACGAMCTLYTSSTHTGVETYFHPGGHEYPPAVSADIVKLFKQHKRP